MTDFPQVHYYITDFATVRLTDAFVEAAKARWPGKGTEMRFNWDTGRNQRVSVDRWATEAHEALMDLTRRAYEANTPIKIIKSLRAIGITA